jgi:hypothetical protein
LLLSRGYEVSSPADWDYNCIAFAADVQNSWWWPDPHCDAFWPNGVERELKLEAFVRAYATVGYEVCQDGSFEPGYEKIAIYEKDGVPTHAAKQTAEGRWMSKLGPWEDIRHNTADGVETWAGIGIYGKVRQYMRRKRI